MAPIRRNLCSVNIGELDECWIYIWQTNDLNSMGLLQMRDVSPIRESSWTNAESCTRLARVISTGGWTHSRQISTFPWRDIIMSGYWLYASHIPDQWRNKGIWPWRILKLRFFYNNNIWYQKLRCYKRIVLNNYNKWLHYEKKESSKNLIRLSCFFSFGNNHIWDEISHKHG